MYKKKLIVFLCLFCLLLSSCSNSNDEVITTKNIDTKIISTNSSATDILVALGVGNNIIAVDTYSDTSNLKEDIIVMDFLEPNIEAIIELEPDIIFYTNYYGGYTNPFEILSTMGIELIDIPTSTSVEGICDDILFYGEITNTQEVSNKIVDDMKSELKDIMLISENISERKKVYFELDEFEGRLYSTGSNTYINDIIEIIGADNIFANTEGWITPTEESIVTKNPDVIITSNIYADNIIESIKSRPSFVSTTAVLENEVYIVDDNLISKGTHNIIDAIKVIAEIVYADEYSF